MYFSDLHVDLLSRGLLAPGETLVTKAVGEYKPWWALGLIKRLYLVLATDRRLILLDHRSKLWGFLAGTSLVGVESIAWPRVQEAKMKGLLGKKLQIDGQGERGPINLRLKVPTAPFGPLAVMKANGKGAQAIGQVFQNVRSNAGALTGPSGAPMLQGARA